MLVADFHFDLPEELIAQKPPAVRGASRMLTLDRATGACGDHHFAELPSLLRAGDLLVLNDSRVIPARLFATREGLTTQHNSPAPSGHIEVLLTRPIASAEGHNDWLALVKPAKKIQAGETLHFRTSTTLSSGPESAPFADEMESPASLQPPLLTATVIATGCFGERTLRFAPTRDFHATLEAIGHLPLPPYIHRDREQPNTAEDKSRYQTVYAAERGSAAAPTAGLHFTPEILDELRARGVEIATVTLHVGLGTFQPVRVDSTEDIRLHAEPYTLSAATAEALTRARQQGRRIIAVGTTTTRTLEHIAREAERASSPLAAHSGSTSLFLSPGLNDEFKLVSGLLTNFHLPGSTLLMLVSAFASVQPTRAAYAHAIAAGYRFFSYGDCMLIL